MIANQLQRFGRCCSKVTRLQHSGSHHEVWKYRKQFDVLHAGAICVFLCHACVWVPAELVMPGAGYDGTPNESAADVLVRVRQALSVMETQYDEELVMIIAPDSTVLSILQAALLGIDLQNHWNLAFRYVGCSKCQVLCTHRLAGAHMTLLAIRATTQMSLKLEYDEGFADRRSYD
jgi:Histidine phosphatase superfamily (branch 1)